MNKHTKRNCSRKNKSMKKYKGGVYETNPITDVKNPTTDVKNPTNDSWFSSFFSKNPPSIGGKKHKKRRRKSKSCKK